MVAKKNSSDTPTGRISQIASRIKDELAKELAEFKNTPLGKKATKFAGLVEKEIGGDGIMTFVGYDKGLGSTWDAKSDDYGKQCQRCNTFENGIVNQGMFQFRQLDSTMYQTWLDWFAKHDKLGDIAKINFFYISNSLVDAASPLMDIFPVVNIYHSAIGMTFEDKNGKIIRSAILELEFGSNPGLSATINRYLAPQMCMSSIKNPDGSVKSPLDFDEEEFIENLFIDTSGAFSSFFFDFVEKDDGLTQDIVEAQRCVVLDSWGSGAPMPYNNLMRQAYTAGDLYSAYDKACNGVFKGLQGDADGKIFLLCGFGPSPLTTQAGAIVNFASTTNMDIFKRLFHWSYQSYGQCSRSFDNNLQYYCILGVDKVTPLDWLSNSEIKEKMKLPNIISTDNGWIREMRGRTTHCNTVAAVYITLLDMWSKNPPNDGTVQMHTDWEGPIQDVHHYMVNPTIANFPLVNLPEGWEYGVSIQELNTNEKYKDDKRKYYEFYWFVRMMGEGMLQIAIPQSLGSTDAGQAGGGNSMFAKAYYYLLEAFGDSKVASTVVKEVFSKADASKRYTEIHQILQVLLVMYVVFKFGLYEDVYWVTGQSMQDINGKFIQGVTNGYPTVFKIPLKDNVDVLLSYIESVVGMYQSQDRSYDGMNAGQIYALNHNKASKQLGIYSTLDQVNRWSHPFPNNKFYMWFPGKKIYNECQYINYPDGIELYFADYNYELVPKTSDSDSLHLSIQNYKGNAMDHDGKKSRSYKTGTVVVILVTVVILIIIFGLYMATRTRKR